MTRFRFPLLCSALLLAGMASAQTAQYVYLHFYKMLDGVDVSTAYGAQSDVQSSAYYTDAMPEASTNLTDPGLRLVPGETFRILKVMSAAGLPDENNDNIPDTIPFTIDATGIVIPQGDEASSYTFEWFGDPMVVPNGTSGVPVTPAAYPGYDPDFFSYGTVSLTFDITMTGDNVALFLVTMDTREPGENGNAWDVGGSIVARYGVAYLTSFQDVLSFIPQPVDVYIGRPADGSVTACYGNPAPVRPTAGLTEYGELSGADLAKALTPTLKPAGSSDCDALAVIPSVGLNLYRYTVETTGVLGGEWEPLDTWVEREGVSGGSPFGYSAVVPDGQTELVLPRKDGESQRFYRLVAPGK